VVGTSGGGRNSIYVNTTPDDKLLFVAEEGGGSITVIDLERARRDGYKAEDAIGSVPVGSAPIALTFSPDGKWLYTTSQGANPDWGWPAACKPEGSRAPNAPPSNPEGAVVVVDVARAKTDPAHAAVARVPAACSPVRMSISPKGDRIFVTARNSNAVLAFDTGKLVSDGDHAMVGIAPVGSAPVPVMLVDGGKKVVVGNSNRFAGGDAPQSLVVLDAARIGEGIGAVLGIIPAGAFPREMAVSADGQTLFLTNFGSNSLQMMDVAHLPIDSKLPPEIAANAEALAHRHDNKPVTVDPKLLSRYVGVYRADSIPMVVGLEGNQLTATLGPPRMAPALAESDTRFFVMGVEMEFPAVAEGGHAEQVTLHSPRGDTVCKRLDDEAAKPVLDSIAAFAKRLKDNTPVPGSEAALRKLIAGAQAGKRDATILAADWEGYLPQFEEQASEMGTVKSIQFQGIGPAGPDLYIVESDKGAWNVRIWMTADGKVQQVFALQRQQ